MSRLSKGLIHQLAMQQLSGDVLNNVGGTVIHAMTSSPSRLRDVAAISEAYSLLAHFINEANAQTLAPDERVTLNALSVFIGGNDDLFVLTIPVLANELRYVAHWLCDGLRSDQVAAMEGTLCLPFIVERITDASQATTRLYPDWTACFFAKHNPEHCFPLLVANSMLDSQHVPDDWVPTALHRLSTYQLPVDHAIEYVANVNVSST